jgi:hypothetical protein
LLEANEPASEPVEPEATVERAERDRQRGIEIVQVPAQPLLCPPPLTDQVVAVMDEQLQLAQTLFTRPRMIEARLAQRRPGDGEGVDRNPPRAAVVSESRRKRLRKWKQTTTVGSPHRSSHPNAKASRANEYLVDHSLTGELVADAVSCLCEPNRLVRDQDYQHRG